MPWLTLKMYGKTYQKILNFKHVFLVLKFCRLGSRIENEYGFISNKIHEDHYFELELYHAKF